MTRITGLATGLDVDTLVKQTMQAYQSKIDVQKQQKDVIEIKQQLYRDLIKEAQDIYNKHFDILKDGSLIKGSTWQNIQFESDSSNLIITGNSSSKVGNYTIEKGSTTAKPASIIKTVEEFKALNGTITINGESFTIEEGKTNKETAENLNKELSKRGINVTVRYTDFETEASLGYSKAGFIFESKVLGEDSELVIGSGEMITHIERGSDATSATITGLTVEDLKSKITKDLNVTLTIGKEKVSINIAENSENSDIESSLNKALKDKGYTASIDKTGNITLTTVATGSGQTEINNIEIEGTQKSVNFEKGKDATPPKTIDITSYISGSNEKIMINGKTIDLSTASTIDEKVKLISDKLGDDSPVKINIYKDGQKEIVKLESQVDGSDSKIEFFDISNAESAKGKNANIIISNGTGEYVYTKDSNTFTVDDITFSFTGDIPSEGIKVSSSKDSSKIFESIKSYIEDYNSLMTKINTLLTEKRDRNYQPLTDAQKEAMSDKEIELWEAKVKQGQLRSDSDLRRISSALRQGMTTLVSGVGLTLKDIGIESVKDYGGVKDGTFNINEDTLKKALENNLEEVAKMFTQTSTDTSNNKYNEKGIMVRLKEIFYDETVSSKSSLAKKVGFEGTTTFANNTLTKQMEAYQKKIDEMNRLFATKEQALYNQYAKLETIMNTYNSQMTYLSQSLGLG